MRSAAVIGLGLIGGSIARDLAAGGVRVFAEDLDPAAVERAIADGVVAADSHRASLSVDVIVIAVPACAAVETLRALDARAGTSSLVIDVGSTKASIVAAASLLPIADRFVGCHPLAGDHRSGYTSSRRGMFEGERVYVCPTARTSEESLKRAVVFWETIGASVVHADAAEHDRLMAAVSHVPQIASSALANTIGAAGITPTLLGRGGRDMTRLAGSSPEMWTQLCVDNAEEIARALDAYRASVDEFAEALRRRDEGTLRKWFREARRWGEMQAEDESRF